MRTFFLAEIGLLAAAVYSLWSYSRGNIGPAAATASILAAAGAAVVVFAWTALR